MTGQETSCLASSGFMHRFAAHAVLLLAVFLEHTTCVALEPVPWGISTASSIHYTCSDGYCRGNELDVYDTSLRQSFASAETSESKADFGMGRAVVEMIGDGRVLFPRIRGRADSVGPNIHWNSGYGIAIEGYRYIGQVPTFLEFEGTLSGQSNGTKSYEGLTAEVYLFKEEGFTYQPHLPTLLYETAAKPITNFSLRISSTNSGARLTNKVAVPVVPGETIYLFAQLGISVFRVNGFSESVEGLQINSPHRDLLHSHSLLADTKLEVLKSNNGLSLLMSPTRRPFQVERAIDLVAGWNAVNEPLTSLGTGFSFPIQSDQSQQFWRVRME